ncbi:MAG: hypothetical protein K6L60_01110 [Oceanobacter sp.]
MMLILSKILVTFLTVVLLARVAERMSPRHAGLLAGFPLGTGIALYFFGWQQGAQFAADSAVYALSGLSASAALAWGYAQVIVRRGKVAFMPLAIIAGLVTFFVCNLLLQQLPGYRWVSLMVVVAAIVLFRTLLKPIPEVPVAAASQQTAPDSVWRHWLSSKTGSLIFRASMASLTILMITGLSALLGPERAGLLAAFPVSFFPLMLILHLTYGADVLATTIKHYPDGLGSLVVYTLAVSFLYPVLGIHWGTLVCLLLAAAYLVLYGAIRQYRINRQSAPD